MSNNEQAGPGEWGSPAPDQPQAPDQTLPAGEQIMRLRAAERGETDQVTAALAQPEAASAQPQPAPAPPPVDPTLPDVSHTVTYYPRPGEGRAGRLKFPAWVIHRDEAERTLDLLVFYDHDDVIRKQRVPERTEAEPSGWVRTGDSGLLAEVVALRKAVTTIDAQNHDLHERLLKIEGAQSKPKVDKPTKPAAEKKAGKGGNRKR